VMSLVSQIRGSRDNDPRFGARMRGSGEFAAIIARRFAIARRRHGLDDERAPLDTSLFRPPAAPASSTRGRRADDRQLDLF
jgi:hypothetical protein